MPQEAWSPTPTCRTTRGRTEHHHVKQHWSIRSPTPACWRSESRNQTLTCWTTQRRSELDLMFRTTRRSNPNSHKANDMREWGIHQRHQTRGNGGSNADVNDGYWSRATWLCFALLLYFTLYPMYLCTNSRKAEPFFWEHKYIYSYNCETKEIQRNNKIILDMRWHIIQYYPLPSTYSHLPWASQRDGIYVNILYLL